MNMNWIDALFILAVGTICGAIGQVTSRYSKGGWFVHLGLGWVGAGLGTYLSRALGAPLIYNIAVQKTEFPVIWSLVGSVFLVAGIGFLVNPSKR